jgi:hypothetical protein
VKGATEPANRDERAIWAGLVVGVFSLVTGCAGESRVGRRLPPRPHAAFLLVGAMTRFAATGRVRAPGQGSSASRAEEPRCDGCSGRVIHARWVGELVELGVGPGDQPAHVDVIGRGTGVARYPLAATAQNCRRSNVVAAQEVGEADRQTRPSPYASSASPRWLSTALTITRNSS